MKVVGEVLAIAAGEIEPGERLRPVDPVWSGVLAKLIDRDGQTTPAEVCRLPGRSGFRLVVGGHRHAACLTLGRPLEAVVGDADALRRRSREISENLFRRGLDPISRAAFVADLITVERARSGLDAGTDGRVASVAARWGKAARLQANDTNAKLIIAYGWTDEVAAQLGLSKAAIYRDVQLHQRLVPDVQALLSGFLVAAQAAPLRALAKLEPDKQRQAARLLADGGARTIAEAIGKVTGRVAKDPDDKAWSAFVGGWERMSKRRRIEGLRELERMGLPAGVKISFGGGE